jgi:deazaflavin-dependent oxidoreductase (nitroreductase family)
MATIQISRERVMERIRHFNRKILNPFTLSFAGRRGSIYTAFVHEGRRTGKNYATPVLVYRQGDAFVAPLPYGEHVDWLRNVQAAGGCTVIWQGQAYRSCTHRSSRPRRGCRPSQARFSAC